MTHHYSHRHNSIFWAVIIILVGLLLLLNNLNYIDIGDLSRDYWPVILILVGIFLLIKRERRHDIEDFTSDKDITSDKAILQQSNVFGDLKVNITSQNFQAGKFNTTFGDIVLDLEKLDFSDGEKLLDVQGVFGDIKISLKKELPVFIRANVTAGEIKIFDQKADGLLKEMTYQSDNYQTASKKLKISISQVFGEIKVW